MILFLSLLCLLNGCTAQPAADATAQAQSRHRDGKVILFRGAYFGMFSQGLDAIARELHDEGIEATVLPHNDWSRVAEQVPAGHPGSPLILIGHSFGADAAIHLARDLGRSGEDVALLITLDPVSPPAIPPSVLSHWNAYQASPGTFNPPWFKGRRTVAEVESQPVVENQNLWTDGSDLRERRLSHWNLTEQPKLQRAIVQRILSICPKRHD